jgi:hypothetical protein
VGQCPLTEMLISDLGHPGALTFLDRQANRPTRRIELELRNIRSKWLGIGQVKECLEKSVRVSQSEKVASWNDDRVHANALAEELPLKSNWK